MYDGHFFEPSPLMSDQLLAVGYQQKLSLLPVADS
jgi:hypothetical protein